MIKRITSIVMMMILTFSLSSCIIKDIAEFKSYSDISRELRLDFFQAVNEKNADKLVSLFYPIYIKGYEEEALKEANRLINYLNDDIVLYTNGSYSDSEVFEDSIDGEMKKKVAISSNGIIVCGYKKYSIIIGFQVSFPKEELFGIDKITVREATIPYGKQNYRYGSRIVIETSKEIEDYYE